MRPGEVLDAQGDLIDRLRDRPMFQASVDAWAAMELSANGDRIPPSLNVKMSETIARHATASYAYRVTHDMSAMVEYAASQLDPDEEFDQSLAPTGCGFVAFDKPLPVHDIRGKVMLIHYLVWGPVSVGVANEGGVDFTATQMTTFNDLWRQPDEIEMQDRIKRLEKVVSGEYDEEALASLDAERGRWAPVGMELIFDSQALGQDSLAPTEVQAARILAEGDKAMPGTNPRRYLQALWLLLNQTVTKVEDEQADRPSRRRATKRGLPPKVTVIRLRREVSSLGREPGESLIEWQHRWIVRRHWRWQPYGSRKVDHQHLVSSARAENGYSVRRCQVDGCDHHEVKIIIEAHVKGPADKPFVQSEKLYSLDR